jgi:hypothetical protein
MPKGVAKSGLRMTKQRLAAFEATAPELAQAYREEQLRKNPLHLVASFAEQMTPVERSDEEIEERLAERFEALSIMVDLTAHGMNRSLIISGPAGLGKTHESDQVLEGLEEEYHVKRVSGFMRLTGMYRLLYENRHPNCTIVFDDSDSIYSDDDKLNLLKNATDTKAIRKISWGAETSMETENGQAIPREFVFEGNIIFITNTDMEELSRRGGRLAPHFEALISRSHYLDLGMKSNQDYLVRIRMVCRTGMLRQMGIGPDMENMILDYIEENQDDLRELSLRMVLKLAKLAKMMPDRWIKLASATCLKVD